ncbi:hypothetical protein [Gemella cuniculi]|uniref:hypothetical protein n=1 Tax=Gemella cuniculi TaxID=150240 RepID=UPI0004074C11|nr:hypothetical protein [Gemella cuniculi]
MNKFLKVTGAFILGIGFLTGCSDKIAQKIDKEDKKPAITEVNVNERSAEETKSQVSEVNKTKEQVNKQQTTSNSNTNVVASNPKKEISRYNHDFKEVEKVLTPLIYGLINQSQSNMKNVIDFCASRYEVDDVVKNISSTEVLDLINTYNPKTYHIEDILKELREEKNINFLELDKSKKDYNDVELEKLVRKVGEKRTIVYFKKDNSFLLKTATGLGGASNSVFAPKEKWEIRGDRIIIPYVTIATNKPTGVMTVRLNNKNYASGKDRTMYYVESFILY